MVLTLTRNSVAAGFWCRSAAVTARHRQGAGLRGDKIEGRGFRITEGKFRFLKKSGSGVQVKPERQELLCEPRASKKKTGQ